MVFNNDCRYYSTLQNSVDILSFSNLIQNSIHNHKKQHVTGTYQNINTSNHVVLLQLVHIIPENIHTIPHFAAKF